MPTYTVAAGPYEGMKSARRALAATFYLTLCAGGTNCLYLVFEAMTIGTEPRLLLERGEEL